MLKDCNNNGLAAAREKSQTLLYESGQLGPIGASQSRQWTIPNVAVASTDVQLRALVQGDFDSPFESLTVKLDTTFTQVILINSGSQCAEVEALVTIPLAVYNSAIQADGSVTVRFETSVAVDPMACPQGMWVDAALDYLSATALDCNTNGLPDSCELASGLGSDANNNGIPDNCESQFTGCPPDFDGDNIVGGIDLGTLLSAWGSGAPAEIDLNADGVINALDLTVLLSAWGPCSGN